MILKNEIMKYGVWWWWKMKLKNTMFTTTNIAKNPELFLEKCRILCKGKKWLNISLHRHQRLLMISPENSGEENSDEKRSVENSIEND